MIGPRFALVCWLGRFQTWPSRVEDEGHEPRLEVRLQHALLPLSTTLRRVQVQPARWLLPLRKVEVHLPLFFSTNPIGHVHLGTPSHNWKLSFAPMNHHREVVPGTICDYWPRNHQSYSTMMDEKQSCQALLEHWSSQHSFSSC